MKLKLSYTGQNDLFVRRILKEELFCSFNDKNQEEAHICNHNLYYELAQTIKKLINEHVIPVAIETDVSPTEIQVSKIALVPQ